MTNSCFPQISHRTVKMRDLNIFYREAGPPDAPVVLLLHGFPTSSHMFRNLIPTLADEFRLVAPDYPGYGASSMPSRDQFRYTFDNLASVMETFTETIGVKRYAMYIMDFGSPVGFRLALKHPERVTGLIVQNGNAYEEGLTSEYWNPVKKYWADPSNAALRESLRVALSFDATKWGYVHGVRDAAAISPDSWFHDQYLLDRPGSQENQLDLFLDYGTNPKQYPQWQAYLREQQPPTLVVWGKNDPIFPAAGAEPYKRDLKNLDYHLLDTGHFALEEDGAVISELMRVFLKKNICAR